ncbi:MAG TPA: phosphoribosyltransferase family protein [Candidatus Sulfomarinibacteraceae bacterium]|nr:phosphoribosyltransferase family protein [Candidatus Sulfomarinibacteraceae bacterium]
MRDAIHALKYEGMFGVTPALAALMVERWPAWVTPVDLVVPIPLHPERKRERGYNQAALLAEQLCQRLALPVDRGILRRIRHTRPQIGLDREQRKENVAGAFVALSEGVADLNILLIDDVCTTGATLSAAATALLDCGARRVSAYCLAQPVQS